MKEASDSEIKPDGKTTAVPSGARRQRSVLVRYGRMGFVGQFRHSEREIPPTQTYVIVHTERGLEVGSIISSFCYQRGICAISKEKIDHYCEANGPDYPFSRQGRLVRFATDQDLNEQRHLDANARNEARFCTELIEKMNLPMKVVVAEHLFGGDRIVYYFKADGRVDFRDLVKELARQYQTRIEMRQIGARDEARLNADFETCGRECCCKSFLKVLQPITMRMAKLQKATLDPAKISGRCGRLKCCLRYEDQVYSELAQKLPRSGSSVLTEKGPGMVVDIQVLTQLVRIRLDSGSVIAVNVDEILDRNYKPPAPTAPTVKENQGEPVQSSPAPPPESQSGDDTDATPARKRRRRKKRRSSTTQSPPASGDGPPQGAAGPPNE